MSKQNLKIKIRNTMAQAAREREDHTHPEKIYKDLMWLPSGPTPADVKKKLKPLRTTGTFYDGDMNEEKLCWSCGWSVYHELTSSYGSRLRIFHTHNNAGIWEVGSRWMIRDQPNDATLGNDFMTQEFLRNHTPSLGIPLLKEMRKLSAPTDKVDLTLMSRAQGVGLDTIWHTLTQEQKSDYTSQLGTAIKSWRKFTSPVSKKANGDILDDCIIGNCLQRTAPTCKKMGRTTDEWFSNLEEDLRFGLSRIHKTKDPMVIEEKFQELRKNFPKSEPYVLTHGDLNFTNIMVKDGKIEAIIDWEYAGYMPWWAERWLSLIGGEDATDELFDPLWADIGLEMDEDTFQTEVIDKVAPVIGAWEECLYSVVDHPGSDTKWLRPGFCECKPFAGAFRWTDIGNQPEHKLKDSGSVKNLFPWKGGFFKSLFP